MKLLINETVKNKLTDEQVLLFEDMNNGPDDCDFYTHFHNCDFENWCEVAWEGERLIELVLPDNVAGTHLHWVIGAIINAVAVAAYEDVDEEKRQNKELAECYRLNRDLIKRLKIARMALEEICANAPSAGEDVSYLIAKRGLDDETERDRLSE